MCVDMLSDSMMDTLVSFIAKYTTLFDKLIVNNTHFAYI